LLPITHWATHNQTHFDSSVLFLYKMSVHRKLLLGASNPNTLSLLTAVYVYLSYMYENELKSEEYQYRNYRIRRWGRKLIRKYGDRSFQWGTAPGGC